MDLFGPAGLSSFFSASNCFYRRPLLEVYLKEIETDEVVQSLYQDANIEVDAVSLSCEDWPRERNFTNSQQKKPRMNSKKAVVSYIVTMKDIPGKFDPVAATALKVPKGPLFGKLSRGETVTLPDGRVILPSQVVSEPFPGPCIAIICCPSIHYISSVTSTSRLSRFALRNVKDSDGKERHLCMVHMATHAVLKDKRYIEWAISLGEEVYHFLLTRDSLDAPLIFEAQAELLKLLSSSVDEKLFQIPKDISTWKKADRKALDELQRDIMERWSKVKGVMFGDSLLKYHLAPRNRIGVDPSSMTRKLQIDMSSECDGESKEGPLSIDSKTSEGVQSLETSPGCFEDSGELIFLGTGAAIPSKLRNVSGIYLHLYHRGGILLDCGEGTFGQMFRVFGIHELNYVIGHLKLIFISHMHADHHLGILRILEYRLKLDTEQPLIIMGPSELSSWLSSYQQVNDQLFHYVFMDNESFTCPQQPIVDYLSSNIGLQVETVPVLHCFHAYGIVLYDNVFEWKMVYSGDTMPCDALIDAGKTFIWDSLLLCVTFSIIGQGATFVIHEATFESSMDQLALEKGHCTFKQAVEVCKAMKAQWVILTHFSQRYSKLPVIDSLSDNNLFVAFDLLRVPFSSLSRLPSLLPVVCEQFKDEEGSHSCEPNGVVE